MKRVGIYLGFPPEGGGAFQYSQAVLEALANLPRVEYNIIVAFSNPIWSEKLNEFDNRFEFLPIQVNAIDTIIQLALRSGMPINPWRSISRYIHPLTRRLLKKNCDLWIFPAQDVWTYAIPTPAIGVIHDLMHRYEPHFPEVSKLGLFYRRERHYKLICRFALGILVDSEVGKHQVLDSYSIDGSHIHVLPFVAPSHLYQEGLPKNFEHQYCLPEKFIFYPAQFWEHKNHINLLRAFSSVLHKLPNLHLVLSGSKKNTFSKVMLEIEKLKLGDRVHVLGYVPDAAIAAIYRRARALVMPTYFGPTNIPPLEAMTVGCPVAVSNVYGMPDQVGDAALLFNPDSIEEIADIIFRLATEDELCKYLSKAGKSHVTKWGQLQFNNRFQFILESVLSV